MGLLARLTRRPTLAQVRHVVPVTPRRATGLVAEVYRQVERDFGMLAPPVSLHSPAPSVLAACWLMLRETLLISGGASRSAKEAVAVGVSLANRCPYCAEIHGMALEGLLRGRPLPSRLSDWARGLASLESSDHLAEYVGTAVTFHYLNRMVNVFLPKSPVPPNVPAAARPRVTRIAARLLAMLASGDRRPGHSLELLPPAPLPVDMQWAVSSPTIASAFARAAFAIESSVPPALKLASSDVDSPAGQLASLLTSASYRVTPRVVAAFRSLYPDDATLIAFCSWVSLSAARQHGLRLASSLEGNSYDRAT